jgi:hypothetical protein
VNEVEYLDLEDVLRMVRALGIAVKPANRVTIRHRYELRADLANELTACELWCA